MVIDDTLTTGGSIINTIKEIQSVGADVKLSLSIFDRNEGGKEKIEKLGINHYSIFRYDKEKEDLVFKYVSLHHQNKAASFTASDNVG